MMMTTKQLTKEKEAQMWNELTDYTIDENECIEQPFHQFPIGTHREEIWLWLEQNGPIAIIDLMFPADVSKK